MKCIPSFAWLLLFLFCYSCKGKDKSDESQHITTTKHVVDEKYIIDTKESVLTWKGSMLLASEEEHAGYVYISKGELMVEKGKLVGGAVEVDMHSIEYKDKQNKNTPVFHLKSTDYFDVKKFPLAAIAITNVSSASGKTIKVSGNLTIKEVTRPVSFPAQLEIKDDILHANGRLVIDRTNWGIRYSSGKFYDIVADQIVADDIELYIKIVAKK